MRREFDVASHFVKIWLARRREVVDICLVLPLTLCPSCARHIRADEFMCPFCTQRPRLTVRLAHAAQPWSCSLQTLCLVGTIVSGCNQRPVSQCAGTACINSVSNPVPASLTTGAQSGTAKTPEPAPATSEQRERNWHPVYGGPRPPKPKPSKACRCDPGEPLCNCY